MAASNDILYNLVMDSFAVITDSLKGTYGTASTDLIVEKYAEILTRVEGYLSKNRLIHDWDSGYALADNCCFISSPLMEFHARGTALKAFRVIITILDAMTPSCLKDRLYVRSLHELLKKYCDASMVGGDRIMFRPVSTMIQECALARLPLFRDRIQDMLHEKQATL